MANTLILIDRREDPWKRVNVTLVWKGGGYDHVWVDESGQGKFNGSGTVIEVQAPGEKISVYKEVNGDTTFVAKSQNAH
jgi:hypothetical protein